MLMMVMKLLKLRILLVFLINKTNKIVYNSPNTIKRLEDVKKSYNNFTD